MIQGSSHFQKVLTVLSVTYLLHVNAASNNNEQVINDINKLEGMLKTLKTPPELVDSLFEQFDKHCKPKDNRTIDKTFVDNAGKCIEQHLNMTQLTEEMKAAVPEGKMDQVFRDICVKWPHVKKCVQDFFEIVQGCWDKGGKIDVFVNQFVKFFCGDDNSGERIAIFFAEGGLQCIQDHGNDVKACLEAKNNFTITDEHLEKLNNPDELQNLNVSALPIPKKDEICVTMEQIHECASKGLHKCNDPTTENLMTSMLRQAQKELECKPSNVDRLSSDPSGQEANNALFPLVLSLAMLVAGGGFAF